MLGRECHYRHNDKVNFPIIKTALTERNRCPTVFLSITAHIMYAVDRHDIQRTHGMDQLHEGRKQWLARMPSDTVVT